MSCIMSTQKYQFHLVIPAQTEAISVRASGNLVFPVRYDITGIKLQPYGISLLVKEEIPYIGIHHLFQIGHCILMAVHSIKLIIAISVVPVGMGIDYNQGHTSGNGFCQPLKVPNTESRIYQHSLFRPKNQIAPRSSATICIVRINPIYVLPKPVHLRIRVYPLIHHPGIVMGS